MRRQIVQFRVQERFFFAGNRAIVTLQHALYRQTSSLRGKLARSWLFPEIADLGPPDAEVDRAPLDWHDVALNAEQQVRRDSFAHG